MKDAAKLEKAAEAAAAKAGLAETSRRAAQVRKQGTDPENLNATLLDDGVDEVVIEGSVATEKSRPHPRRRPVQQMAVAMDDMGPRRSNRC